MEFSVSKADLVRELGLTQGVVERRTTIPILSNILVETDHDQVWLTATDLELGIRCACPARVKKEGAGTIPARRLLQASGAPVSFPPPPSSPEPGRRNESQAPDPSPSARPDRDRSQPECSRESEWSSFAPPLPESGPTLLPDPPCLLRIP